MCSIHLSLYIYIYSCLYIHICITLMIHGNTYNTTNNNKYTIMAPALACPSMPRGRGFIPGDQQTAPPKEEAIYVFITCIMLTIIIVSIVML